MGINRNIPGKKVFVRLHRSEIDSRWLTKIPYNKADGVIFVNPHFLDMFDERLSSPCPLYYIPNAIDTDSFPFNIPPGKKALLAYGTNFLPVKGYDNLIRFFKSSMK